MQPTAALLMLLTGWVSQLSGLPIAPVPQVELTEYTAQVATVDHGKTSWWRAEKLVAEDDGCHAGAVTVPGRVYLHPSWRPDRARDICTLAHELTHVAQFNAGIVYRYTEDMEPLAYAVQRKCEETFGLKWGYRDDQIKQLTSHDLNSKVEATCGRHDLQRIVRHPKSG